MSKKAPTNNTVSINSGVKCKLVPLSAALCADDTGASVTQVNWSVLSSVGPVCAAGTSFPLPELPLSAGGHIKRLRL